MIVYAESKLANILHAVELQRRYGNQGIRAYSLHPEGVLTTELNRDKTSIQAFFSDSIECCLEDDCSRSNDNFILCFIESSSTWKIPF